jgi:hypothetical protein
VLSKLGVCATTSPPATAFSQQTAAPALQDTLALIAGWAELLAADPDLPEYVRQAAQTMRARAIEAAKVEQARRDSAASR